MGDGAVTYQGLERLTYMPDRDASDNGLRIAGQYWYDVYFTGGEISNVTLTNPTFTTPVPLSGGGTGAVLADPGADRIGFWDASAGTFDWLIAGSGLVITDKTMTVAGVGLGDVTGPGSATNNAIARFDGLTGKVIQNSGALIDDSGNISANNLTGTNTGDQIITLTGNVTGSGTGSFSTTIATAAVTNAMLRNSAALSVIGRSANSSGVPADIAAANDGEVLRRSGTSIGFGKVEVAGLSSGAATNGQVATANGSGGVTYTSLGTMAAQNASSVAITGGSVTGITDLAIADGGTGASTAVNARTNLGTNDADNLTAGTVATARLGSGTANSTTYLRGDQTWDTPMPPTTQGAIGTYVMALDVGQANAFGGTRAGGNLAPSDCAGNSSGSLSGTWRCMGRNSGTSGASGTTLWLRIS